MTATYEFCSTAWLTEALALSLRVETFFMCSASRALHKAE